MSFEIILFVIILWVRKSIPCDLGIPFPLFWISMESKLQGLKCSNSLEIATVKRGPNTTIFLFLCFKVIEFVSFQSLLIFSWLNLWWWFQSLKSVMVFLRCFQHQVTLTLVVMTSTRLVICYLLLDWRCIFFFLPGTKIVFFIFFFIWV